MSDRIQRGSPLRAVLLLILWVLLPLPTYAQFDGTTPDASTLFETDDEFLPVEEAYKLQLSASADGAVVLLNWDIADKYYLYRKRFSASLTDGSSLALDIPQGKVKQDEYFGEVQVFYNQANATFAMPENVKDTLEVKIVSQGCADAGLCYPPRDEYFALNTVDGTARPIEGFGNAAVAAGSAPTFDGAATAGAKPQSALLMALFAFLGGIVLNLMPCVFPVLALKVMGLVQANEESAAQRRLHGFSYTGGVLVCFLLVAGVLLALRDAGEQLGWGFQLQSPWFVAALVYLFFAMGLSLAGMLNIGASWAGAGQGLTEHSGIRGSFFTGVLAVVVASPCTAPFMGVALGFALSQPTFIALSVFLALGLGMAAPFLLLVLVPKFAAWLPRPGAWMNTLKEVLAFPLYATAVWLLWVIGRQTGADGMAAVAGGCLLIAFAVWLLRPGVEHKWFAKLAAAATVVAALAILPSSLLAQRDTSDHAGGASYDAQQVADLRASGKHVFVNVTADWCITCLANERVALGTDTVLEAFQSGNIAYLKGDWTNRDATITALLQEYGRSGVPLYLLFPADQNRPAIILPQLLTPALVLDAIAKL